MYERSVAVGVRLPEHLLEKVDRLARETRRSRSNVIRILVEKSTADVSDRLSRAVNQKN